MYLELPITSVRFLKHKQQAMLQCNTQKHTMEEEDNFDNQTFLSKPLHGFYAI